MYFDKNPQRLHWVLLLAVTIFSLYMNATAVGTTLIDGLIRGDARDYLAYAFNLKTHGVYSNAMPLAQSVIPHPDALRAPGYAFFIAPFVDAGRNDLGLTAVLYLQALLGALTTLFSMLIFRKIMPFWAAIACGLLTAISPHLINISVYILTESLFTFLLITHVYTLVLARERANTLLFILSGLLLAASWLVRPTTMLLVAVYILVFAWAVYRKQIGWRALACLILPFFIAFSGWSIRNELAIGRMSDPQLSVNFIHHGSYINMMYQDKPETYGYPYRFETRKINSVGDAITLTIDHFKAEPARYMGWILFGKPVQFLSWDLTESIGDAVIYAQPKTPYADNGLFIQTHRLAKLAHLPMMLLAAAACIYFLFKRDTANFALQITGIVVLYFIAFHAIGSPFPRYSIPIRPLCYGLAFWLLIQLCPLLLKKQQDGVQTDADNGKAPANSAPEGGKSQ
ncbi:hypothetical protein IGB42_02148 [Andreprevotia sp. IGB-42]|uniref:glycosyltransferase family 39 protein n=1 Tax=Andreprevotia sp. IGB-42 TaxID=2497473 RepID=UPI001357CE62|nr:glycosyltransferase family 39 protein [Andreprevotia sp. IGB-42]KAF0813220.1 hypothetical protein IGB42_02148 [Andreprevotia sp. IGB-42]